MLALAACGGKGAAPAAVRPAAERAGPTPAEVAWRRRAERYTLALAVELARLRASTGGGPATGPVGPRIDPRALTDGARRRALLAALTSLRHCRQDLAAALPAPPTPRLLPVRAALGNACSALADAAGVLAELVSNTGSARDVDGSALAFARNRAAEGVRILVDALATLARVVPAHPA